MQYDALHTSDSKILLGDKMGRLLSQVVMMFVLFLPISALSQDYTIFPYSHFKKLEDGTRSNETRIRIFGYGIMEEIEVGKGLDIGLGGYLVDSKRQSLPLMSGIKGWGEIEPVDYQFEEFEEMRKRFIAEVQKKVANAKKLPEGSLNGSNKKKLKVEIQQFHEQMAKEAYKIFLPSQITHWKQFQFRNAFSTHPHRTLSDANNDLKLQKPQLTEISRIETDSANNIKLIKSGAFRDIEELKANAKKEMLEVLDKKQMEELQRLLGDNKATDSKGDSK